MQCNICLDEPFEVLVRWLDCRCQQSICRVCLQQLEQQRLADDWSGNCPICGSPSQNIEVLIEHYQDPVAAPMVDAVAAPMVDPVAAPMVDPVAEALVDQLSLVDIIIATLGLRLPCRPRADLTDLEHDQIQDLADLYISFFNAIDVSQESINSYEQTVFPIRFDEYIDSDFTQVTFLQNQVAFWETIQETNDLNPQFVALILRRQYPRNFINDFKYLRLVLVCLNYGIILSEIERRRTQHLPTEVFEHFNFSLLFLCTIGISRLMDNSFQSACYYLGNHLNPVFENWTEQVPDFPRLLNLDQIPHENWLPIVESFFERDWGFLSPVTYNFLGLNLPPRDDENPLAVDENPLAVDENPPAGDENPPAGDENPPAVDENPQAVDENPPAGDENPPAVDENPPAVDENPPAVDENPAEFELDFGEMSRPELIARLLQNYLRLVEQNNMSIHFEVFEINAQSGEAEEPQPPELPIQR